jgi:hypothetical protein
MLLTVKNISKREEVFDIDIEEKVSTLAELVKERFEYTNKVKLIYAGQILLYDEKISKYLNEADYGFIVCFQEKTKSIPAIPAIPETSPLTPTSPILPPLPPLPTLESETPTEVRSTRAILFAFFRFIQSHESLNYIYFTNPGVMNQMFKDKKFDTLIAQLIENKDIILDGLENNRHTEIDLTLDEKLVNSIMMNLFFNNNN